MISRRIGLVLLLVISLIAAGIFCALHTTVVTSWIIRRAVQQQFPSYQITHCSITRQQVSLKSLSFDGIDLQLKDPKNSYQLNADTLVFDFSGNWFSNNRTIDITLKGGRGKINEIRVDNVNMTGKGMSQGNNFLQARGQFAVATVELPPYKAEGMQGQWEARKTGGRLSDLTFRAFGGECFGHILLEFQPVLHYSINLEFKNLALKELEGANLSFFSQMSGRMDGTLNLSADIKRVRDFSLQARMQPGGKIRSAILLGPIIQNVPNLDRMKEWENLIAQNSFIPMEVASLELNQSEAQKISGGIKINAKAAYLNLNMPTDINYDGSVWSLVQLLKNKLVP